MIRNLLSVVVLLLISGSSFAQKDISESFTGIEKISISTASSDCILKKSSNSSVLVELEHTYSSAYDPEVRKEGNRLVIKERFERNSSSRGSGTWTLTVPDEMDIRVNSGSGSLEAADLNFELDMNTGSGYIELTSVSGELDFNTGSGDITLSKVDGEFDASTGSGSFRVTVAQGDLRLSTGSGNIRLKDLTASVNAITGSGNVRAENVTLTEKSYFSTGSGDAIVVLNSALTHDIDVNSGSGDAEVDFSGNAISGFVEMNANKKNGRISAPFDFDKVEEIEQGSGRWSQMVIKKTAQLGSDDVRISISTGSGTARISK
ncbi:MAG: DUF4097 family beta strand repeat-containing protein [Bacteroidota bacterium]